MWLLMLLMNARKVLEACCLTFCTTSPNLCTRSKSLLRVARGNTFHAFSTIWAFLLFLWNPKSCPPRTQILKTKNPALRSMIFNRLTDFTDGVFLWVELQLNTLCRQRSDEDVEKVLSDLPKDLGATYARLAAQIPTNPNILQALAHKCLP